MEIADHDVPAVNLTGVEKRYGPQRALAGVSLHVARGEMGVGYQRTLEYKDETIERLDVRPPRRGADVEIMIER